MQIDLSSFLGALSMLMCISTRIGDVAHALGDNEWYVRRQLNLADAAIRKMRALVGDGGAMR